MNYNLSLDEIIKKKYISKSGIKSRNGALVKRLGNGVRAPYNRRLSNGRNGQPSPRGGKPFVRGRRGAFSPSSRGSYKPHNRSYDASGNGLRSPVVDARLRIAGKWKHVDLDRPTEDSDDETLMAVVENVGFGKSTPIQDARQKIEARKKGMNATLQRTPLKSALKKRKASAEGTVTSVAPDGILLRRIRVDDNAAAMKREDAAEVAVVYEDEDEIDVDLKADDLFERKPLLMRTVRNEQPRIEYSTYRSPSPIPAPASSPVMMYAKQQHSLPTFMSPTNDYFYQSSNYGSSRNHYESSRPERYQSPSPQQQQHPPPLPVRDYRVRDDSNRRMDDRHARDERPYDAEHFGSPRHNDREHGYHRYRAHPYDENANHYGRDRRPEPDHRLNEPTARRHFRGKALSPPPPPPYPRRSDGYEKGRPFTSTPVTSQLHRITISNLHEKVTGEDIKELFEEVGKLVYAKMVRPGTAEVAYKTEEDADKAVEIYHNRQLDGLPMRCTRGECSTKMTRSGKRIPPVNTFSSVEPDVRVIKKALFTSSPST